MRSWIRRRGGSGRRPVLTYANVIATLALFLALGGVGYAATRLPKNSIGAAQLQPNSVGSSELQNHSIAPLDLSASAQSSCPGGTVLAAGVCIEKARREANDLQFAIVDCAQANRALPSEGELSAYGSNYVSAKTTPPREWAGGYYEVNGITYGNVLVTSESSTLFATAPASAEYGYRCAVPPGS